MRAFGKVHVMTPAGIVALSNGPLELWLAPETGGSIARFDWSGHKLRIPILRGAEGMPATILDAASFPMVPFVNRVRGGRFRFRGKEIVLAPNMAGDASPLHGQGWLAPWQIDASRQSEASLSFLHGAGEWPWDYRAEQHFRLDEAGLNVRLSCRNLSGEPMPCGLGQHPYFPCSEATRLDTGVTHAWTIDQRTLPIDKVPAEDRYDLRDRAICGQALDHGFGGWTGSARIVTPGIPFVMTLSSPNAAYFQLYSPAEGDLFVAEPVSHANAALNAPEEEWPGLGLRVLEPGEEMSLDMRVEVSARETPEG